MISSHSGLVLLHKPPGITSFRVLNFLKKKLDSGKVGHTGTLDKFAEGLILVLTGKMTKLASFFSNMDKEYLAVYKFGEETNTLDPEGKITATAPIPSIDNIEKNIKKFIGNIMQRPPDFSAIHINGQRAYKIAASGEKPNISERAVIIYNYEIVDWDSPYLTVKISCSKGTYIRSLARDLGRSCASRSFVSSLIRTSVGSWNLSDSIFPYDFNPDLSIISGLNLFKRIPLISTIFVSNSQRNMILSGFPISRWKQEEFIFSEGSTAIFDSTRNFLALIENRNNNPVYKFVQDRL